MRASTICADHRRVHPRRWSASCSAFTCSPCRSGGKLWFYWIAPLLAIGFFAVMVAAGDQVLGQGRAARDQGSPPQVIEPGDGEGRAPDPVDWATARRVARFVAGRDPLADSYLAASLQTDFDALTVRAEDLVAGYTGLRAPGHATARVLDRRDWVESNITSMRALLDPLMQRFGERLAHNPFAPVSRRVAATEMGGLLGYLAQRVLGQYDLLVPDGPATIRAVRTTARPRSPPTPSTTSAPTSSRSRSASRSAPPTSACGSRSTK